ncbi:hypothetical protein OED52_13615 [Rhodococcus sp. Z13]|uniref:Uncharacterized protein n=1 Tax=Rhodococcus sacchari TaxID=2962047 RepID=A0ACD4DCE6_9NOCA|nr:phage tail tape measure protein [Rhodococcus sp. Z13]UYP17709.1 hypothetical protein OED52_13615 [Rhodococcus sp. Z13]
MTSPSGSISIGVSVDANDLPTEITRAVQSAMGDVLRNVRSGMGQVEGAFGNIDTSGFADIARAAREAAEQAEQAAQRTSESSRRSSRQMSEDAQQASRSVTTALQRIDASSLSRIASGADDAMDHLRQLDRWQLQALAREVNRAGELIGNEIEAGASHAERTLRRLDATQLDGLLRSISDVQREMNQTEGDTDELRGRFEGLGSSADGLVGKLGGVAAGIVGISAAMDTVGAAIEQDALERKLAARLEATGELAEFYGDMAGNLFKTGIVSSMEEATIAIDAVASSFSTAGFEGEKAIDEIAAAAQTFANAWDVDVTQAVQTASQLVVNGLANDSTQAFDLMTTAWARVPMAMREELPEIINEYGEFFRLLGFQGDEAFSLLVDAADKGKWALDKTGDALKEFTIRGSDMSKASSEAYEAIGLDAEEMSNMIASGGERAQEALQKTVQGLLEIEDPADRANTAIALFGTPLEDLAVDQIPGFLQAISGASGSMAGFEGAMQQAADTMNSGPSVAIQKLKNTIQSELIDVLGRVAQYFMENQDTAKILAGVLGTLVGAYAAMRTAAALSSVALGISTAATGGNTAALAANRIAMGAAAIASGAMRAAQVAGAAATGIATAAQWAWNAAMSANPIGIVIVAIGALVAALVAFFTKTELGREIWQKFVDFLGTAWEAIKAAFAAAWEFIQPIFQTMWDFISNVLVGAWNGLVSVVQTVWNAISAAISAVWNNVISPIFNAWQTVVMGIIVPVLMFLWNNVVSPVFQGIANIISTVWNTIISVVFTAFKAAIDALAAAANWLWTNAIQPAWDGIGAAINFVWNSVIMPVFDFFKAGMDAVGAAAEWLWNNVITPVWNGIGDAIRWVIDNVIKPAWDGMKSALQSVGDFFGTVVDGIKNVWDGLRNILAKPINFMIGTVYNNGIRNAWNKIREFIPNLVEAPELPLIPEYRKGGRIVGPGTGTSDDVLMWGSNGEHMVTAAEVIAAGGHGILYAIRDMILRGIPFTWDNGRIISELGADNLASYGAAVQRKGFGNVDPQGLFDKIYAPAYANGGEIKVEPWMLQLARGHEFARSQHGKPYQWAGPTGPGSSFDCSGFMASIAAVILGGDPWRRYWYTGNFAGYPQVGPQGFTKGLGAGFTIGVTDDPGGPGGGHTAGVLGEVPGMYAAARVESGGSIGGVHYGAGPDVRSFAATYTLPIGANGFFQPGEGMSIGPSPEEQRSFLVQKVHDVLTAITDPIKGLIVGAVGSPPPHWREIPPRYLDAGVDAVTDGAGKVIDGLGDALSSAWTSAKRFGSSVLDALNPFDSGGLARGKGFLPKNIIAPERVLSPQQTELFEILVRSLEALARGDYDGGLTRVGIQEDHPLVDAALTMREVAVSIDNLINRGDYDGTLSRFGIQEDHPLIDAVLSMREAVVEVRDVADSVGNLVHRGDYDGVLSAYGIQEDHPLVDAVLSVREVAQSIDSLVGRGDYDGVLSRYGIQEDNPLIDAALSMRDTALAVQDVAGSVETLVRDGDYDGTLSSYGMQEDHPFIAAVLDLRDAVVTALGDGAAQVAGDIIGALAPKPIDLADPIDPDEIRVMEEIRAGFDEQGELLSDTVSELQRTASSQELVQAEQYRALEAQLVDLANRLSGGVLGPMVQTAMRGALGIVEDALAASADDVIESQDATTEAVKDLATADATQSSAPVGMPGSSFDLVTELGNLVQSVTDSVSQSLIQVGNDIAKAALQQQKSSVDNPRGVLGDENNSGGTLIDTIVRLTGVEIEVRDTIYGLAEEIRAYRGDEFQTITDTGELISDTASLIERSASSTDLVIAEQNRINRELIKSVLRYLLVNVVLPAITAIMTGMISILTGLIGAAIGGAIAGPIGAAIGVAVGGLVGMALSGLAAAAIAGIGVAAGAAIDSFDQGGIANGIGVLPKNTVQPERVLSPRQTAAFERLVDAISGTGGAGAGSKTVQVGSINVHGSDPAAKTNDRLLSLLNS